MPLYMDTHGHIEGLTAEAVTGAHAADLQTQGKYGVKFPSSNYDDEYGAKASLELQVALPHPGNLKVGIHNPRIVRCRAPARQHVWKGRGARLRRLERKTRARGRAVVHDRLLVDGVDRLVVHQAAVAAFRRFPIDDDLEVFFCWR